MIAGPNKEGQEARVVTDSRSGDLVGDSSKHIRAGLEYFLDTLSNNISTDKFKLLNQLKAYVHQSRMKDENGHFEIYGVDLRQVVERFLIKAGKKFKRALFKLCLIMG